MQSFLFCLIFIGALSQLALSQEVNSRAANPDEPRISAGSDSNSGLGGQARSIYSQKLSGHRMMHFGKKQVQADAPDLVTPYNQAIEVYPMVEVASAQAVQRKQLPTYPYTRMAQTIPDEKLKAMVRRKYLMEIVSNLLEEVRSKECDEPQRSGQKKQKRPSEAAQQVSPMRRMLQDNSNVLGFDFGLRRTALEDGDFFDLDRHRAEEAQLNQQMRSSNLVEAKSDEQVGEQQGQENGMINLENRSVPMEFGSNVPSSTRAFISSILYGKQAGQRNTPPPPNYAKKYDPNRMKFMHFG